MEKKSNKEKPGEDMGQLGILTQVIRACLFSAEVNKSL